MNVKHSNAVHNTSNDESIFSNILWKKFNEDDWTNEGEITYVSWEQELELILNAKKTKPIYNSIVSQ